MRADRLVQLLLFLQQKEKVTVAQVAEELEISARTARRDLEALAMSGVPVYSQPGRGGGWRLLGGATTDLSGLTQAEVRSLFVAAGAAAGVDPQLRAALRKLTQAVAEPFRAGAQVAAQTIMVDADSWGHTDLDNTRPEHFNTVSSALLAGHQLELDYEGIRARTTRTVHPLGLVEKQGRWYLVTNTDSGLRTFRLDRIRGASQTAEPARVPPDFDLQEAWEGINQRFAEHTLAVTATLLVHHPRTLAALKGRFKQRLTVRSEEPNGSFRVEIAAWSAEAFGAEISSFGRLVQVEGPKESIEALVRIGRELQDLYS